MKPTRIHRASGLASRHTTHRYAEWWTLISPVSVNGAHGCSASPRLTAGGRSLSVTEPGWHRPGHDRSSPAIIQTNGRGETASTRPSCGDQKEKKYCACPKGKQYTDGRMPETGTLCSGCNTKRCPDCDGHINPHRRHTRDHCADGLQLTLRVRQITNDPRKQEVDVACENCGFQLVGSKLPDKPVPESVGLPKGTAVPTA